MPLNSADGYILLGKQTAKGVIATPTIAVPHLSDQFSMSADQSGFSLGQDNDYLYGRVKTMHREGFGFSVYARPKISAYLLGYILGDATISGAGDPYTHTLTRGERAYLTLRRKLSSNTIHQLRDSKIESIDIVGECGKPILITAIGQSLSTGNTIYTTLQTPSYDTENTFMFYHGAGRFKYNTTVDEIIKSFSVKINVSSEGGFIDDQFSVSDLPEYSYGVDVSAELYTDSFARWKSIVYYDTSAPSENIKTGAFELDLRYTKTAADDRQFKITIPFLRWETCSASALNPAGETMTHSIAGIAEKMTTTELMTVTMKNAISTTII